MNTRAGLAPTHWFLFTVTPSPTWGSYAARRNEVRRAGDSRTDAEECGHLRNRAAGLLLNPQSINMLLVKTVCNL